MAGDGLRGKYSDDSGNRCLVDALNHLDAKHSLGGKQTAIDYLLPATRRAFYPVRDREMALIEFNDGCRRFATVKKVIEKARERALADRERRSQSDAALRRLQAELEQERLARLLAGDTRETYILCPELPSKWRVSRVLEPVAETPITHSNVDAVPEMLKG